MRPLGEIDFASGSSVLRALVIVSYRWGRGTSGSCGQSQEGDRGTKQSPVSALTARLDADLALGCDNTGPWGALGSQGNKRPKSLWPSVSEPYKRLIIFQLISSF